MEFEQQVEKTRRFICEVATELESAESQEDAYHIVKSVFHTMREILTPLESYQLIAQLPYYLKGVYVDGWKFEARERIRSISEFIDAFSSLDGDVEKEEIHSKANTLAVVNVLKRYVRHGEVRRILDDFPAALADVWINDKAIHPAK